MSSKFDEPDFDTEILRLYRDKLRDIVSRDVLLQLALEKVQLNTPEIGARIDPEDPAWCVVEGCWELERLRVLAAVPSRGSLYNADGKPELGVIWHVLYTGELRYFPIQADEHDVPDFIEIVSAYMGVTSQGWLADSRVFAVSNVNDQDVLKVLRLDKRL